MSECRLILFILDAPSFPTRGYFSHHSNKHFAYLVFRCSWGRHPTSLLGIVALLCHWRTIIRASPTFGWAFIRALRGFSQLRNLPTSVNMYAGSVLFVTRNIGVGNADILSGGLAKVDFLINFCGAVYPTVDDSADAAVIFFKRGDKGGFVCDVETVVFIVIF